MMNVPSIIPPLFTYDNTEYNDLDFALLADYLIEDDHAFNHKRGSDSMLQNSIKMDKSKNDISDDDDDDDTSGDEAADSKKQKNIESESMDRVGRRRERNRVLARKTRLRKKFFYESLQRQVAQLAVENDMLKGIIKQKFTSELRHQLLSNCRAEQVNTAVVAMVTGGTALQQATSTLNKADYSLMVAIQSAQRAFVVTDPNKSDSPIIYASPCFEELTGYQMTQIVGRSCRFLHGADTDPVDIAVMSKSIASTTDTSACLLNYKADGTPFYDEIFTAPLRDINNNIVNYVAVHREVCEATAKKIKEDNMNGSISSSDTVSAYK